MSSEDRDLELAILTRRLLSAEGYYTELKVPVFLQFYGSTFRRSTATDVDVLGIRFDLDMTPTVAVVEAKSGEDKALEELLKLRAVAEYVRAARMYFVKTRVHGNAREVGRSLGIVSASKGELTQMLRGLGIDDGDPYEEERKSFTQQKEWLASMRRIRGMRHLANYIEAEAWSRSYWENVHNLMYFISGFLEHSRGKPPIWAEFVVLRAVAALSVSVLHLCRQIMLSSLADVSGGVGTFVFGGAAARRQRERLRDEILKILPSLDGMTIPIEPQFLDGLKELVAYLLLSPVASTKTPLVFQEAIDIVAVGGGRFDATKWSGGHDPVSIKLAKDILQFAVGGFGVTGPIENLSAFLAL